MIQTCNKLSEASALTDWQIQDIKKAINEVDAGDFATRDKVKAIFEKWKLVANKTRLEK